MGKDKEKRVKIPEQIINDVQAYLTNCEDLRKRGARVHMELTRKLTSIEAESVIERNKMWDLISEYIPEWEDGATIDMETMELVERKSSSPFNMIKGLLGGGSQWGDD